jgi:hypothetical protein
MTRINWDRARIEYEPKPLRVTFKARFGTVCSMCGRQIKVGTRIASLMVDGRRRYGHEDCVYGPRGH